MDRKSVTKVEGKKEEMIKRDEMRGSHKRSKTIELCLIGDV
jgi:hypothetical protein